MKINKMITNVNCSKGNINRIKYIVIHYVGATGGAQANCKYFKSNYRGASAHYFVGHKGEVWQCVNDKDIAWHCGSYSYKHKYCRNENAIGIELCCYKKGGKWAFYNHTVNSAIALTKELMAKYGIPASHVIRHYDVTGKCCPEPYVRNNAEWRKFKKALGSSTNAKPHIKNFKVRVTTDALNIRKSASINSPIVGCIKDRGVYTIVNKRGAWGKLKSGKGYINLGYTEVVD